MVFEKYKLDDEIPVNVYIKKRKLAKYFNRESAAAIVAMGKLLKDRPVDPETPFFYAKGIVEFEDYELPKVVKVCSDENGQFSQEKHITEGTSCVSPLTQFKILYNMPACFVSIENGLTGDNAVIYSSAQGLLAQALTAETDKEMILGAGKVYRDGTVESGFAIITRDDVETSSFINSSSEAIEIFREWNNITQKSDTNKKRILLNRKKTRVVITGAGVVSPIGSSVDEFMKNLQNSTRGSGTIENFDTRFFPVNTAAEAKKNGTVIRTELHEDRKDIFIRTAVAELMEKHGSVKYPPEEIAMHMGTGIDYFDLVSYINSTDSGSGNWQPYCPHANITVEKMAKDYLIKGGHSTNVSACVASTQAMGLSFRLIRDGFIKAAVTGGYDSMLCHLHYMGFYKLGALSDWKGDPSEACRPFDKERRGLVLGEGGVAFSLENEQYADRNSILGEIAGYCSNMDSYMVTDPDPTGNFLAKAALKAIAQAEITPEDIDCVHLHGTGTFKNELAETKAMEIIFGKRFKDIPVYSMKGQIGHLIGACGAMEMLGVIYSIRHQKVLPTVNFHTRDNDVPLNVVNGKPLEMPIKNILKLNAAFGGQNTAFVVRKYE